MRPFGHGQKRRFDTLSGPLVHVLRVIKSPSRLRRTVWRLDGEESASGRPLSVLCAVSNQTRHYLAQVLFRDGVKELELGRAWAWNLSRAGWARRRGCSIIVIQPDEFIRPFLKDGAWFFIPLWVIGDASLPIAEDIYKSTNVRSDMRVIRKAGLRYRVTRDPACFDDFYRNIYVPHVTNAYGASVYVNPYDTMKARLADGELLLINDGEQDIAGMMVVYENGRPRLWSLGVRDGDRRHLKRGALAAVYYFAFRHFAQKGFRNVGLGLSRAFLNDGVLRYKAKWGQRLVGTVPDRIAFTVVDGTPASASLLQNNPFIFERSGTLYSAVFLADGAPLPADRARALKKAYLHEGLAKLVLFLPRPGDPPSDLELPPDVLLEPFPF